MDATHFHTPILQFAWKKKQGGFLLSPFKGTSGIDSIRACRNVRR